MGRQRQASTEVRTIVTQRALEGNTAASIWRELTRLDWPGQDHPLTERTIATMVREVLPPDDSSPWSLAEADPDDAAVVLPLIVDMFRFTNGNLWPSKSHVDELARVMKVAPGIPPMWAWFVAQAYRICKEEHQDSRHLDVALALRPWENLAWGEWLTRAIYGDHALGGELKPGEGLVAIASPRASLGALQRALGYAPPIPTQIEEILK